MKKYRVYWEIDVYAGSPLKAAETALRIQRDPESTMTVFDVAEYGDNETLPSVVVTKQFALSKKKGR